MGTDDSSFEVLLLCLARDDVAGNAMAARLERAGIPKVSMLRPDGMERVVGLSKAIVVLWTKRSIADDEFRAAASLAAKASKAIHVAYAPFEDNDIWSGPVIKRGDDAGLLAAVNRLRGASAEPAAEKPLPGAIEAGLTVPELEGAAGDSADAEAPETPGAYDVFLSYKREERDFARALYAFLRGKRYRVWWDNALFAGDNFKEVVTEQVGAAKCVVVLWSKLALASEYVVEEARIAYEAGTLVNMVIDDLAFEKIPEPMSDIHGERLGADRAAFFEIIAAAIRRKVERPTGRRKSATDIQKELDAKDAESDTFLKVLNADKIDGFRVYLIQYGDAAQYAGIARDNIARLEKEADDRRSEAAARRSLWRRTGLGLAGGLAVLASVVAILQYMHVDLFGTTSPTVPAPTIAQTATTAPSMASAILPRGGAELELASGEVSVGTVTWEMRESIGLGNSYIARIVLPTAPFNADVTFNPPAEGGGDVSIEVRMDGVVGLANVEADGQSIAASEGGTGLAGVGNAARGLAGGDANLAPLANAGVIALRVQFPGGLMGVLRLTGPEDPDTFLLFLTRSRQLLVYVPPDGNSQPA